MANLSLITSEVTRYMDAAGLTQTALARELGITQAALSKKIRGDRSWTLRDLDRLAAAGVPITVASTTLGEVL